MTQGREPRTKLENMIRIVMRAMKMTITKAKTTKSTHQPLRILRRKTRNPPANTKTQATVIHHHIHLEVMREITTTMVLTLIAKRMMTLTGYSPASIKYLTRARVSK